MRIRPVILCFAVMILMTGCYRKRNASDVNVRSKEEEERKESSESLLRPPPPPTMSGAGMSSPSISGGSEKPAGSMAPASKKNWGEDEEFVKKMNELVVLLGKSGEISEAELVRATEKGDIKKFSRLVEKGINVNVANKDGKTVLMEAVEQGQLTFAQMLIDRGADVNRQTQKGDTALKIAMEKGNEEIQEILRAAGAKE